MILNIRGCNGSGKTTLARSLLDATTMREVTLSVAGVLLPKGKPPVITVDAGGNVALIGPYVGRKTGGCDCLPDFATVRAAIDAAALLYPHVVFEGVTLATVYSSWAEYDDSRGRDITWAFLDTPLEVCLARIYQRNGGQPIKEKLVADKHRSIQTVRGKALADHRRVVDVPGLAPVDVNANYIRGILLC